MYIYMQFKFFNPLEPDIMYTHHAVWCSERQIKSIRLKVKQFLSRPGRALGVPGGWGSQISRQSAHEGGNAVSPTFTPQELLLFLVLISVKEAESTQRPQCGQKDYVNKKFQWHHLESNPQPSEMNGIADGLLWPLLYSPYLNSGLMHITHSTYFQHQNVNIKISNFNLVKGPSKECCKCRYKRNGSVSACCSNSNSNKILFRNKAFNVTVWEGLKSNITKPQLDKKL
jgi:hypothetical protein